MIVVAACSLAGVGEAASQTKHLAGVVRDEAGNPVPGVSVKILDSWQSESEAFQQWHCRSSAVFLH